LGTEVLTHNSRISEVPNPQERRSSLWHNIKGTKHRVLLRNVR